MAIDIFDVVEDMVLPGTNINKPGGSTSTDKDKPNSGDNNQGETTDPDTSTNTGTTFPDVDPSEEPGLDLGDDDEAVKNPTEYYAEFLSSDRTKKLRPVTHPRAVIDSKGNTMDMFLNRTAFYQETATAGGIDPEEPIINVRFINRAGDLLAPVTLMSNVVKDLESGETMEDIAENLRRSAVVQIESHYTSDKDNNIGPIYINIEDYKKDADVLEVFLDRGETGSLVNGERLTKGIHYSINTDRNALYLINGMKLMKGDRIYISLLRTITTDELQNAVELIHALFDTALTYDTLAAEDEIVDNPILDDNINTFKGHGIEEFMLWANFKPGKYVAEDVTMMQIDDTHYAQNLTIENFEFVPGTIVTFKAEVNSELVNYIAINGKMPLYQLVTPDLSTMVSFKKYGQITVTLSDTKGIDPVTQNCLTAFFSGGGGSASDETLPPQITNLKAVPTYQSLTISFDEIPDEYKQYLSGYRIVLKEGGIPKNPNDGMSIIDIPID